MPELSADLAFTRAIPLAVSPPVEALVASNLFRTDFNSAMYRQLGAAPELSFVARQLRATNIIEQDIGRRLRAANHPVHGTRSPFKVMWNGQAAEMYLTTKVFPPDVLVVTVHIRGIQVDEDRLMESLVSAQQGLPERLLPDLQRILGSIIVSADRNAAIDDAPRLVGSTWPTTLLRVDVPPGDIAGWVDERWSPLCAAVIRDEDYKTSDERVLAGIRNRNSELNAKGGFRRLLDKQGGLLVAATRDRARANIEFKRLVDLQTIGLVFIDGLVGVDETAKAEAKGILAKMCSKGGEVASAAAGGAGGALLGAVLKQILGLP